MDPKHLVRIERTNCLLAGLLTLVAAVAFDVRVALGVAAGGVLACANFYALHKLLEGVFRARGTRRLVLQLLLTAKMGVLLVLIFLVIRFLPIHPVAFCVGLSVFLVSIAIETVRGGNGAPAGGDTTATKANDGRA